MSEIDSTVTPPGTRPRTTLWAVLMGLVFAVLAVGVALVMAVAGLVLFNGCFGTSSALGETLMMGWIFVLWPLSAVGAGVAPAVMVGRGRGWKKALLALGAGSLIAFIVYIGWLVAGSIVFC